MVGKNSLHVAIQMIQGYCGNTLTSVVLWTIMNLKWCLLSERIRCVLSVLFLYFRITAHANFFKGDSTKKEVEVARILELTLDVDPRTKRDLEPFLAMYVCKYHSFIGLFLVLLLIKQGVYGLRPHVVLPNLFEVLSLPQRKDRSIQGG